MSTLHTSLYQVKKYLYLEESMKYDGQKKVLPNILLIITTVILHLYF